MSKLQTLTEHNDARLQYLMMINTPTKSGVACPKCGTELLVNYMICLTSNPPQYNADCPNCKFHTTIY